MKINRATDYAVRVMLQLASLPLKSKGQLVALERATGVRGSFLSKVLQRLVHAGLVTSYRGNGGGFCLPVNGDKISLLEVIEVMEGPTHLNQCLISGLSCERKPWCGVHPVWERAQAALKEVLGGVSIGQLARDTNVYPWTQSQLPAPLIREQNLEGSREAKSSSQ